MLLAALAILAATSAAQASPGNELVAMLPELVDEVARSEVVPLAAMFANVAKCEQALANDGAELAESNGPTLANGWRTRGREGSTVLLSEPGFLFMYAPDPVEQVTTCLLVGRVDEPAEIVAQRFAAERALSVVQMPLWPGAVSPTWHVRSGLLNYFITVPLPPVAGVGISIIRLDAAR